MFQYYPHAKTLFGYFANEAKPLAKNGFFFISAGPTTGEACINDFPTFYAAGLLNKDRIEKHLDIDVYDPFLFTQAIERVSAPLKPQGTYCLQYPPIFFTLFTPLAYFNLYTAWRIWFFVLALCVVLTYVFIAYDSLKTRPLLLVGLFIALTTYPVTQNFFLGQTTCIEAAIIALSFRLLADKKYFWGGLIGALSALKLHQMLIVLIPGFCLGRKHFLRGVLLMGVIEIIVSALTVGWTSTPNFIRTNYMAEFTHSFSDMNDIWLYLNFMGLLQCLPWFISNAAGIGAIAYILVVLSVLALWLKVFPLLQRTSNQAFQIIASITTVAMIMFALHGYWYDPIFYIIPCVWLCIWSTSNDHEYGITQSVIRLIIFVIILYVPLFFWSNVIAQFTRDTTVMWCQIRVFICELALLSSGVAALIIDLNKSRLEPSLQTN